ncbi:hypothetical protein RB608_06055 [Nocardioides sp. LHD-245]|uniref:hypothetical protein n=1 Tax=Nocardioides sp. LHD-245 TaxID=3051387 RepID=UPI0027E111F5|nr:hypothetical protein [Nocardioides sp. LHD-245]
MTAVAGGGGSRSITQPWRDDLDPAVLATAVGRCLGEVLELADWEELGRITGTTAWICGHPRLLSSLTFGESDYLEHVRDAVPVVLGDRLAVHGGSPARRADDRSPTVGERFPHLGSVAGFVGLREWLALRDPATFARLYAPTEGFVWAVGRAHPPAAD